MQVSYHGDDPEKLNVPLVFPLLHIRKGSISPFHFASPSCRSFYGGRPRGPLGGFGILPPPAGGRWFWGLRERDPWKGVAFGEVQLLEARTQALIWTSPEFRGPNSGPLHSKAQNPHLFRGALLI